MRILQLGLGIFGGGLIMLSQYLVEPYRTIILMLGGGTIGYSTQ